MHFDMTFTLYRVESTTTAQYRCIMYLLSAQTASAAGRHPETVRSIRTAWCFIIIYIIIHIICILVVRSSLCVYIYSCVSTTTTYVGVGVGGGVVDLHHRLLYVLYLRTHAHPSHVPVGFIASDTQPSCLIARDGITLWNSAQAVFLRTENAPHHCNIATTREPKKRKRIFEII